MSKEEKTFEITGTHQEKGKIHKFSKTIIAGSENFAIEKLMSQVGSKHGTKRRNIVINEMKEKKGGDSK